MIGPDLGPVLASAIGPEFLTTALIVVLIPGTGVLYTLAMAMAGGLRTGTVAALGCTFGIVPHLLASVLGLAALLHASAVAFQAVKLAGVAYLLWLAWGLWRDTGALSPSSDGSGAGGPRPSIGRLVRVAVRGALINVLNPKLSIFFLAFLPQFVPADAPDALVRMTALGAMFMLMTFVVFVGYAVAADAISRRVLASARVVRWTQRAFAAAFAGFALRLAVAER